MGSQPIRKFLGKLLGKVLRKWRRGQSLFKKLLSEIARKSCI